MTVNYTTLLALGQPVTGTESGTWGDDVNNSITSYLDIAIAGTLSLTSASFTANALTLANTQGSNSATNISATTAQYMVLKVSSLVANVTITAPSTSKLYLVDNTDATYTVTIKASGQSGYTVATSTKAWVYFNGTDYVLASSNNRNSLSGVLTVANGGTNASSAGIAAFNNITGYSAAGATGTTSTNLVFSTSPTLVTPNLGTPTALTLTNATGLPLTTGVTGTLPVGNGGTGAVTLSGVLKGNGVSAIGAATAGTDYVAPGTATTFTAKQTFNGGTTTLAAVFANAAEPITVSATAATGTINYDVTTQSVVYYTSNAAANWTVNFRGNGSNSLDSLMSTGQVITVTFLVTNGGTPYYNNAVTIDGNSVTPKYQNGAAWTAGNASAIDLYTYVIVKTGGATFTVFASLTKFA